MSGESHFTHSYLPSGTGGWEYPALAQPHLESNHLDTDESLIFATITSIPINHHHVSSTSDKALSPAEPVSKAQSKPVYTFDDGFLSPTRGNMALPDAHTYDCLSSR